MKLRQLRPRYITDFLQNTFQFCIPWMTQQSTGTHGGGDEERSLDLDSYALRIYLTSFRIRSNSNPATTDKDCNALSLSHCAIPFNTVFILMILTGLLKSCYPADGVDALLPQAPSIHRENFTCGYNLQPTGVTRITQSIKDGVAPTRNIGLMLASRKKRVKRRTDQ